MHGDKSLTLSNDLNKSDRTKINDVLTFRSSLFWSITHLRLIVIYRRFGTIYPVFLCGCFIIKMGTIGFPATSITTTSLRRVTSKNSDGLNYAAAEARRLELTSP